MTTLVVGASGATGRLLVEQLLERGEHVRVIVRSKEAVLEEIASHNKLLVIQASVLDLSDDDIGARHAQYFPPTEFLPYAHAAPSLFLTGIR